MIERLDLLAATEEVRQQEPSVFASGLPIAAFQLVLVQKKLNEVVDRLNAQDGEALLWTEGGHGYARGGWYRCVLADGRVVYIGGCGECSTPWLDTEETAPDALKDSEWKPIEERQD